LSKAKVIFVCQQCGYQTPQWLGRCPACGGWNCLLEQTLGKEKARRDEGKGFSPAEPTSIRKISLTNSERMPSGIAEFDRLLGGGFVPGSLVLLAGPPGIGKSTLLLQVAARMAKAKGACLYVSGEESFEQIKLRASRLNIDEERLIVFSETDMEEIIACIKKVKPDLVIIDSIQAVYHPDLTSLAGTVGQVRGCAEEINYFAKTQKLPVLISGQVTKEGAIAGPKILEHTVDTVLYFEETRDTAYRIIRVEKNRFGATAELGIFEMGQDGLKEVVNPSALFLASRKNGAAGSVITALMEGTRAILVELQALVTRTNFNLPRRQVSGLDYNRVLLLVAVFEKNLGISLANCDVFLNIAGGERFCEPACDLGIILAMYSALKGNSIDGNTAVIGEVGLSGEVRAVSFISRRVGEAARLGVKKCIIPEINHREIETGKNGMEITGVSTIRDAIEILK